MDTVILGVVGWVVTFLVGILGTAFGVVLGCHMARETLRDLLAAADDEEQSESIQPVAVEAVCDGELCS